MNYLAGVMRNQNDLEGALPLLNEALEGRREALGERHPDTLSSMSNLGLLLEAKGDLDGAARFLRETLEIRREVCGSRNPKTLTSLHRLGRVLHDKGDLAAAEPLLEEAVSVCRDELGDRHPDTIISVSNLCLLRFDQSRLDSAIPLLREALDGGREVLGEHGRLREFAKRCSARNLVEVLQTSAAAVIALKLERSEIERTAEAARSRSSPARSRSSDLPATATSTPAASTPATNVLALADSSLARELASFLGPHAESQGSESQRALGGQKRTAIAKSAIQRSSSTPGGLLSMQQRREYVSGAIKL